MSARSPNPIEATRSANWISYSPSDSLNSEHAIRLILLNVSLVLVQGAEPVQQSEELGVQGPRRPAARHGAGRVLERRAHPDRDHKLAVSTISQTLNIAIV